MKKNIIVSLCIITLFYAAIPLHANDIITNNTPSPYTNDQKSSYIPLTMVEYNDLSDDFSDQEDDFIADIEFVADTEPLSFKQRLIDIGKNFGVRMLLFMLDARDYLNSRYDTVSTYLGKTSEKNCSTNEHATK